MMLRPFLFILSALLCLSASAQTVTLSPLPQEITWGEIAFSNDTEFYLVGADMADQDAVEALSNQLQIAGRSEKVNKKLYPDARPIIIGEYGDKAVAKFRKSIPEVEEGYYLDVTPGQVVIAGRDGRGTFYGVQTFLQLLKPSKVMQCRVVDYPSVSERGVIEGFYGNPWSHTDRLRQFEFYGQNKLNTYVYGPKDDPYHRARWRVPYPEKEASQLKELIVAAHKN